MMGSTSIVRLAGISGTVAVAFAAYGAHNVTLDPNVDEKRKRSFENANKHHFIHSIGLMLANQARYPTFTAALFLSGLLLFCGPCYAYGIWNSEKFRQITPIGGMCFLFAWLSFII